MRYKKYMQAAGRNVILSESRSLKVINDGVTIDGDDFPQCMIS